MLVVLVFGGTRSSGDDASFSQKSLNLVGSHLFVTYFTPTREAIDGG